MDWIIDLIYWVIVITLWETVGRYFVRWKTPPWWRALRSLLRRRSEPRPRFLSAEGIRDVEAAEKERRWIELANPQPTSAPTSSEATETPEATQHGS